jgi:MFS family permease
MRPMYYNKLARIVQVELPRELWVVQAGVFLNYLGWGCVMPFEVIYLHDGRGFSLGVAGLVVGVVTGLAVVAAPVAGPVIDRIGSRATAAASLAALAGGFAGLAFAQTPAQAFAAAAAAGIGNGGLQPSQSALLASLASPEIRHRATAVSRVASNLGIGLGGVIGGAIAAHGLNGFVALFLVNALTYVLYAVILLVGVREDARPAPVAGGYRVVLRDRPFIRLALINVGMIAVGWGVFSWIVPAYARGEIGVSTRLIGLLVFANAVTVVLAQIPAARLAEGRRRTATMAVGALTFVAACLLVVGAGFVELRLAAATFIVAAIVVAVGECLHTTVLMPLVADLAPAGLRGRYMAVTALSWWLGLALAPTLAAQALSVSPPAAMLASAVVALAAAAAALALEREIPPGMRLTPGPARTDEEPVIVEDLTAPSGLVVAATNWQAPARLQPRHFD